MAIIDELKICKNLISNGGLVENSPYKTCSLLGKYHFNLGKTKTQVKTELDNYLKDNFPRYNSVTWDDNLEKIVSSISNRNHSMIYVDRINITKTEMDKIDLLPSEPLKRLAFIILYRAKLNREKYKKQDVWLSDKISYLCKLARVYGKYEDKMIKLSKLQDFGYVKASHSVKNFSFRVLFLDDIENEDVVISINDTQCKDSEIILHYKKYKGENILDCENCGGLIEPKSNRIKYCSDCAREFQLEHQRNSMKKIRKRVM